MTFVSTKIVNGQLVKTTLGRSDNGQGNWMITSSKFIKRVPTDREIEVKPGKWEQQWVFIGLNRLTLFNNVSGQYHVLTRCDGKQGRSDSWSWTFPEKPVRQVETISRGMKKDNRCSHSHRVKEQREVVFPIGQPKMTAVKKSFPSERSFREFVTSYVGQRLADEVIARLHERH